MKNLIPYIVDCEGFNKEGKFVSIQKEFNSAKQAAQYALKLDSEMRTNFHNNQFDNKVLISRGIYNIDYVNKTDTVASLQSRLIKTYRQLTRRKTAEA